MKISARLLPTLVAFPLLACGGASTPTTTQLTPITVAVPREPVTLCVEGALASRDATDRVRCLIAALDQGNVVSNMDVRESLHEKISRRFEQLGPDRVEAINAEVDRLFDPTAMQASFEAKLAAGHDDAQARRLLEFYATDLGARYAEANAAASDDGQSDAATTWMESEPLSDARKAQIDALLVAVRAPDFLRTIVFVPAANMVRSLSDETTEDALLAQLAQLEQVLGPIVTTIENSVRIVMAYSLRDLTDTELARAVEMEQSPPSQWYTALRLNALQAVLGDAYTGLGNALAAQRAQGGGSPQ